MRLLDMGVQDYLLTSAVNAIQAQRLVRTLCRGCRVAYTPADELVERFDLARFAVDGQVTLYRAAGCTNCGGSGYAGRSAILEILPMTDDIRDLVIKRCDVSEIAKAATDGGMVTMLDDGLFKAANGVTTIEEVLRVAPETIQ
jgi:general secretion pathway protein E